ncbi:MAG: hypothetical protein NTX03_06605 [Bacteroidetes bacterium]|nr:hypothetical protein [Bacteroidota bacterium]
MIGCTENIASNSQQTRASNGLLQGRGEIFWRDLTPTPSLIRPSDIPPRREEGKKQKGTNALQFQVSRW